MAQVVTLQEAASPIVHNLQVPNLHSEANPEGNILFRNLYNGFCRITEKNSSFDSVVDAAHSAKVADRKNESEHTIYGRAFREMWNWYRNTYASAIKADNCKKRNGMRRAVREYSDLSSFQTPYSYRSFLNYIRNECPIIGDDGYSFLLHTSVAFMLSPDMVDSMLVTYGFMPLHIKNLFHVAIHVVLSSRQKNIREKDSVFDEIGECYKDELDAVARCVADSHLYVVNETEAFDTGSTRVIQGYALKYSLSKATMLDFVERHASVFQSRHTRLLSEHKYLVNLFSELYIRRNVDSVTNRYDEAAYSLYTFLRKFCRAGKINRDTYKNEVYWKIAHESYHPTREFMIILWMYAYCFLYLPTINMENPKGGIKDYSAITPFDSGRESPFRKFVIGRSLNALDYLADSSVRSAPLCGYEVKFHSEFRGEDFIVRYINEKLEDYSWRKLDERYPFDAVVMSIKHLCIEFDPESQKIKKAYYHGKEIAQPNKKEVENVPSPLVLITELFDTIKEQRSWSLPLECKCCELI